MGMLLIAAVALILLAGVAIALVITLSNKSRKP
jgi:hypothetical protein